MPDYPFATLIRVRFAETDAQGVAHNASFLVWFEVARVEYLERFAGGYPALREQGIEAFVTEAHVRFGVPARFDDRLDLHARCADVRGARFRFEYRLERDGDLVAEGWTAHACVDAEAAPRRRPSPPPSSRPGRCASRPGSSWSTSRRRGRRRLPGRPCAWR